MRDRKSYCGILLDDNNRKPLCRFYFNNPSNLTLGVFSETKDETRHSIQDLDGVLDYADAIRASAIQHAGLEAPAQQ